MPQNIYDDPKFYEAYAQLPRSVEGLPGAPEWSAVRSLLPDVRGARILDLGCGFGAFDRWAIEHGALKVIGIDLSEMMLRRARELTSNSSIEYRLGDMGNLDVEEKDFDLIYSALAFHYVEDFPKLCRDIGSKLRDGGRLVATVEHPIFSAPSNDEWQEQHGQPFWPLNDYLVEGPRRRTWLADGVVKYHRTVATYLNDLSDASFRLLRLIEWGPDAEQLERHPEWARERDRPMFLLLSAEVE